MRLKKFLICPICESSNIFKISAIKSNIKELEELNEVFDLMKCSSCQHRFISKIPSQSELDSLYEIDSPIVFGKTDYNQLQKKNL